MEKIKYKRGVIVEEKKAVHERIEIDESRMNSVYLDKPVVEFGDEKIYIDKRDGGNFEGKVIYLTDSVEWVLCKDNVGSICLIPLKKEKK